MSATKKNAIEIADGMEVLEWQLEEFMGFASTLAREFDRQNAQEGGGSVNTLVFKRWEVMKTEMRTLRDSVLELKGGAP